MNLYFFNHHTQIILSIICIVLCNSCVMQNKKKCIDYDNIYKLISENKVFEDLVENKTLDSLMVSVRDTYYTKKNVGVFFDSSGYYIKLPNVENFILLDSLYQNGTNISSSNYSGYDLQLYEIDYIKIGAVEYYLFVSRDFLDFKYSPAISVLVLIENGKTIVYTSINPFFNWFGDFNNDGKLDYLDAHISDIETSKDTFKLYTFSDKGDLEYTNNFIVVTPSLKLKKTLDQEPSPFDSILTNESNWCNFKKEKHKQK